MRNAFVRALLARPRGGARYTPFVPPPPDTGPAPLPNLGAVGAPVIDKIEALALGGNNLAYWGGHQTRVTRHLDGSIRVLALTDSTNWTLRKKADDASAWTTELSGGGRDDVYLFRDQVTDRAIVLLDDSTSRLALRASPSFTLTQLPGPWTSNGRDYGGAGIGIDGTITYIQSDENSLSGFSNTANTAMQTNSAKFDGATWAFAAATRQSKAIGRRHGYSYLFPNAGAGATAVGQIDMNIPQETAYSLSGYGGFQYVFNGIDVSRFTRANPADNVITNSVGYLTPINNSTCPERRQQDAFVDNTGRIFTSYQQYTNRDAPTNNGSDGLWTALLNADGSPISTKFWSMLPNYGRIRVVQDYAGAYWLLWTNSGTNPQFLIYPMTVSAGVMSVGSPTNLAAPMISAGVNFNDNSTLYISCPRGGNPVRNYLDCTFLSAAATHYYMRLRLPG